MLNTTSAETEDARSKKVRMLRERYLAGTLDEVLIPKDADFSALARDVFGDRRASDAADGEE